MSRQPKKRIRGIMAPDRIVTAEGAEKSIGISWANLRRGCKAGVIVPMYFGGRTYFETSQIMEYIRQASVKTDPKPGRKTNGFNRSDAEHVAARLLAEIAK